MEKNLLSFKNVSKFEICYKKICNFLKYFDKEKITQRDN